MSSSFPLYQIQDKVHTVWLTWNIAWTEKEALRVVIAHCKDHPGRAVRLVRIKKELENV